MVCHQAYRGRALAFIVPLALASLLISTTSLPVGAWLVGGALVALGWGIRIWAQVHLGYRLPVRMSLTRCGPYRFLRNPIYVANTLVITGAVTVFGWWWALPIAVLWCAAFYSLVVPHEEKRLRAFYGRAYRDYCHDVPRWLPARDGTAGHCRHRLSVRSLLAEVQVPVVLVPAGVKMLLSGAPTVTRYWPLLTHAREWFR